MCLRENTLQSDAVSQPVRFRLHYLLKQLSLLLVSNVISSALSFLVTISLANSLGPDQFGLYSSILVIGSMASLLVNFATDVTAPALHAQGVPDQDLFNVVCSLRLFLFAGVGIVSLLLAGQFPLMSLGLVALSLASLNLAFMYEVKGRNVLYSYLFVGERVFYLGLVGCLLLADGITVEAVFFCFIVALGGSLLLQGFLLRESINQFVPSDISKLWWLFRDNLWLVLVSVATLSFGGFSRLILATQLGVRELGIYSAGWQFILVATIFQGQVDRVFRRGISCAALLRQKAVLKSAVWEYFACTTLPLSILAGLIYLVQAPLVARIFEKEYQSLTAVLPLFLIYYPIINLDSLARMLWVCGGDRRMYCLVTLLVGVLTMAMLLFVGERATAWTFAAMVVGGHGLSVTLLFILYYLKHSK